MKKQDFLNHPEVTGFINFFNLVCAGGIALDIEASYPLAKLPTNYPELFPDGKIVGRGVSAKYIDQAHTLEDLSQRYWWNRGDFNDNANILATIKRQVDDAILHEEHNDSTERTLGASGAVLAWGLGLNTRAYRTNKKWACNHGSHICNILRSGRLALTGDNPNPLIFSGAHGPRMNSGWTKYYSLALPDHVIYDGRVGAGLGFLVRKWLTSEAMIGSFITTPTELAFPWGGGRGANHLRNPSNGLFNFPRLANTPSGSTIWAEANIKANWIFKAVVDSGKHKWLKDGNGMRKLEAAIFMLGYDLNFVG